MRCPTTKQRALARNSNIIEDLGRASYSFSDKTGTLTSNEMRLRGIAVKGASYGNPGFRFVPATTSVSNPHYPRRLPSFILSFDSAHLSSPWHCKVKLFGSRV